MITFAGVHKRFGTQTVLADITLTLPPHSYVALLGPSGSGKSTLLRAVAGLTPIDAGHIAFGDEIVSTPQQVLAPEKRNLGMVFQSYAVWPHMNVLENVAYPLRQQRRSDAHALAMAALDRVQLSALAQRSPETLSGGQQQRVALARALASRPRALLLDEPLANLDPHLRADLADEFRRVHRDDGLSVLHVTHDRDEALGLATHVVVLRDGRVEQMGTPSDVFHRPRTPFVASFVAESVTVPATLVSDTAAALADGARVDLAWRGQEAPRANANVTLCVPKHGFALGGDLRAEVVSSSYAGSHYVLTLQWQGQRIRIDSPGPAEGTLRVAIRTAWAF